MAGRGTSPGKSGLPDAEGGEFSAQTYVEALLENTVRNMARSIGVMARLAQQSTEVNEKIASATRDLRRVADQIKEN